MKTNNQLIEDYKKSNKIRRERIALAAGFKTGEEYLNFLTDTKTKKVKTPKMKGIFYVVDILDATGSMDGGKYSNSVEGIKAGIKDMISRKNVKYSLFEFIQASKPLNKAVVNELPSSINTSLIPFSGAIGGDTPLYWAVHEVINSIKPNKEDKVLIKVYTDGGNNSKHDYIAKAAELIKKVQKENFTVTFVATPEDLKMITRDINVDKSNTFAVENSARGFKKSMEVSRGATMSYFANSAAGMDTLVGFYKQEGTL